MIDWTLIGPFVLVTILVALLFDFYNGLHDAANSIATVVATRALPVWAALLLAGSFNFIGAFAGTAVAAAVGSGIIAKSVVTPEVILAALAGAIFWSVLTIFLGIPISSSQSLIGGLVGAALAKAGMAGVQWPTLVDLETVARPMALGALVGIAGGIALARLSRTNVWAGFWLGASVGSAILLVWDIFHGLKIQKLLAIVLFIGYSPFLGFCLAFTFTATIAWLFRRASPGKTKGLFRWLQIGSSSFYSFGHGTNDAQKTMGVITALMIAVGAVQQTSDGKFPVPSEVIFASGLMIALGTLIGGYKIVKTMGTKLTHLDTSQGFAAETSSAIGLYYLAGFGVPVSTTHSITGAIMGVGAFQRASAVSWGTARRIVSAWIITIPMAAIVAAFCYWVIDLIR
ncbi:MAG: inorganic phosphate transporter [Candidatus Thermoplasmatota archaeon]